MKLIYLSALDAKVVGKTGSLVRSKVLQNGGEYSKSFLFEQCSRDKAKLRAAVILLENEPDKENEDTHCCNRWTEQEHYTHQRSCSFSTETKDDSCGSGNREKSNTG